jgi:hypothetical protein
LFGLGVTAENVKRGRLNVAVWERCSGFFFIGWATAHPFKEQAGGGLSSEVPSTALATVFFLAVRRENLIFAVLDLSVF